MLNTHLICQGYEQCTHPNTGSIGDLSGTVTYFRKHNEYYLLLRTTLYRWIGVIDDEVERKEDNKWINIRDNSILYY